jgi:hypothetical protein
MCGHRSLYGLRRQSEATTALWDGQRFGSARDKEKERREEKLCIDVAVTAVCAKTVDALLRAFLPPYPSQVSDTAWVAG